MKLGVNTVLFKGVDVKTAMKAIKAAGYDGVELSAIQGMCEHLVLDAWETQAPLIKAAAKEAGVELLSMEAATLDEDRLTKAFKAAQYLGIPVVNVGPGGKSDVEEDIVNSINTLKAARRAGRPVRREAVLQGARQQRHLQHPHHAARHGGDYR